MEKKRIVNGIFLKRYIEIISFIFAAFSVVISFIPWEDYVIWQRITALGSMIAILIIVFFLLYFWVKKLSHITLRIKNTKLIVEVGDLLSYEHRALKIIPVNEYFDTKVDDVIIARNTLHGQFIEKYYTKQIETLDEKISEKLFNKQGVTNPSRQNGKKVKYPLGTLVELDNNYVLLAFSKFDDDNRAYLSMEEFFVCLLSMWDNLNISYANRNIVVPMMGTGILRLGYGSLSKQEILEIMIYSLKLSSCCFNGEIRILLTEDLIKEINLIKLSAQFHA